MGQGLQAAGVGATLGGRINSLYSLDGGGEFPRWKQMADHNMLCPPFFT